ncbi:MAG: LLM class flavin-dependent oxidoreductase [Beutenbergiaceae bacterium]
MQAPLFGTFVTPSSANPQQVLDLAVAADDGGLDLVTFQDHPYQPALMDTPTLLSFVAARTSRVHLSANVTNLPLRPPAMLARSAATLDILSGGRFELGIGTGAFAEAIEAIGGQPLKGGNAVKALGEAITLIRELLDTETRGGVRLDGEFFHARGAKRGPATPHRIDIWVGAYGPRMLGVTGRMADGWLPTLEYIPTGLDGVRSMNARIDAAATEAGRAPTEILRLVNVMNATLSPTVSGFLNGPAQAWIDQLIETISDGTLDGVLIGGDDLATTRRFAEEIVPAVRAGIGTTVFDRVAATS